MDSETHLSLEIELDDDGFLRRECPTCEREFKWLPVDGGAPVDPPYCPYCGVPASADVWWTQPQLSYIQDSMTSEIVAPMLDDLSKSLESATRGLANISVTASSDSLGPRPTPPAEPNEMMVAGSPCHPEIGIKILDGWNETLHCLACGTPVQL